ncbi:MAG TPA: hypothetical protein EYN86_06960 [Planctomycetes bacterium]|jgi:hypothetical protein|nr:hypothetical protein [Planctomycetota bacterium]
MNKAYSLIALLIVSVAFILLSHDSTAIAFNGAGNFSLPEGGVQKIISNSGAGGYVTVANNGPGDVKVVVKKPNGSVVTETISPGCACDVWFPEGAHVALKDVGDSDDNESSGSWVSVYPL